MRPNSRGPGRGGTGQRTGNRIRFAGLVAALAAAVLVAAGCSSGSTSSTSAASATSSAASGTQAASPAGSAGAASDIGITATTIRVGLIADVSTTLVPGLFQTTVNTMDAWANEVNASGGLDGRKVVIDFCDSKLDPNASTACTIKACQNDFALVGTSANALVDLSDIDSCKNAAGQPVGIANLAAFAFPPESCDLDTYLVEGLQTYCQSLKAPQQTYTEPVGDTRYLVSKNPGLHGIWLYDTDDPTFKFTQVPLFQLESNTGVKKDGQGFYPVSGQAPQSALTPFIQQVKASGSTFVYSDVTTATMVLLRREAQLQGANSVKVWECNSGCYDPAFYQQGGATVNGTYASLPDLPYLSDYQSNPVLNKLVTQLGGISKLNNTALLSYIMGELFQDAVQKVAASGQTLDRQTLFSVLNSQETSFNGDGLIGPTDISGHSVGDCEVTVQLQNGVWQRVDPVKPGTFDCNPANVTTIKMKVAS